MLSDNEKSGLKWILDHIYDDDDVFFILRTITNGLTTAGNRGEAIELILTSAKEPSQILKGSKVTKGNLFNYLVKHGVSVSADLGKPELAAECLKLWCKPGAHSIQPMTCLPVTAPHMPGAHSIQPMTCLPVTAPHMPGAHSIQPMTCLPVTAPHMIPYNRLAVQQYGWCHPHQFHTMDRHLSSTDGTISTSGYTQWSSSASSTDGTTSTAGYTQWTGSASSTDGTTSTAGYKQWTGSASSTDDTTSTESCDEKIYNRRNPFV